MNPSSTRLFRAPRPAFAAAGGGILGRRPAGEPLPELLRLLREPPLLEDHQRDRPETAAARADRVALAAQPPLELFGLRVRDDRALQQLPLHRQADSVRRGVALAAGPAALGSRERREQLAADLGRPRPHRPPFPGRGRVPKSPRAAARTPTRSLNATRSGRRYPRSIAARSRCTVRRSSRKTSAGAAACTTATALRQPLQLSQTSTFQPPSRSSAVR